MGCGCNKNKTTGTPKTYANKVMQAIDSKTGLTPPKTTEPVKSEKPSLLQKALNLGEAVANHVQDGFGKVTKEELAARLEICHKCPYRSKGTCTKCGCNLSVKSAWRTSTCPDNRWPELKQA